MARFLLILLIACFCGCNDGKVRYTLSVQNCATQQWTTIYFHCEDADLSDAGGSFYILNDKVAVPQLTYQNHEVWLNVCDFKILSADTIQEPKKKPRENITMKTIKYK